MNLNSKVWLVTKDNEISSMTETALKQDESFTLAYVAKDTSELCGKLSGKENGVICVDISSDPKEILKDVNSLVGTYPEKRVVVISGSYKEDLILEAMLVGARNFVPKNKIISDLVKAIRHLIPVSADEAGGSVISVFSSSGGCGATTVTVNIANELSEIASEPVLMVDLDNTYATLSTYLRSAGKYGIRDILKNEGIIDKHLVMTSATRYTKDLHILGNYINSNGNLNGTTNYSRLSEIVEGCRQGYKYTVIDAPRLDAKSELELAKISNVALVVLQPTVRDITFAKNKVANLIKLGVEPDKIMLVANRYKKWGLLLRLDDIKKALSRDTVYNIRSDWRKAVGAINQGKSICEIAPWSRLRRDYRKLVNEINNFVGR